MKILNGGLFEYQRKGITHMANFPLFLIHVAWERGLDLEALADGFGEGFGTMGDWSGIRDSSEEAKEAMLEKALDFLFPELSDDSV